MMPTAGNRISQPTGNEQFAPFQLNVGMNHPGQVALNPLGPTHMGGPSMAPPQVPPPSVSVQQVQIMTLDQGPSSPLTGMAGQTNTTTTNNNNAMANTKEKTPMCLVNELARFNKVQHQYKLIDEQGPAHKKTFQVQLKLGDAEEYTAEGASIKKAQHSAAAMALEQTKMRHPPVRYESRRFPRQYMNVTPTEELNALAMRRGELALYRQIDPPRHPPYNVPNLDFRGIYNQRYHYPKLPRVFYVSLKVGNREFIGEGATRQMARHTAAVKAIKVIQQLPMPENAPEFTENQQVPGTDQGDSTDEDSENKSPISLVHEIALKHNLSVDFEVVKESGPPHMRTFVTICVVGEFSTMGEGNGKKVSKKRAAEKMMEELKRLPPLSVAMLRPARIKNAQSKKKSKNLIKVEKGNPEYGTGINPISRLVQIQQAKKAKEPTYTLLAERGMPRRREFVMQVEVEGMQCTGSGPNKKLAKRAAAEAMLQALGYSRLPPEPSKPTLKQTTNGTADTGKKVTFVDPDNREVREAGAGRALVPGLLLMPEGQTQGGAGGYGYSGLNRAPGGHLGGGTADGRMSSKFSLHTSAMIARELLETGHSPTGDAIHASCQGAPPPAAAEVPLVRPKQQLLYLADVLDFHVQFTDFPKGNKSEYLSLVSLSTSPPQVSHGSGATLDTSHDHAALTALRALADMCLDASPVAADNPSPLTTMLTVAPPVNLAAGDGSHLVVGQLEKQPAAAAAVAAAEPGAQ